MKKFYLIPLLFVLMLTSCYKDEIENLQERLEAIEGTQIASLQGQITAIKNSLPELEKADKELGEYIKSLQNTAANLQESINSISSKINDVESSLKNDVSQAKVELLAQLTALKTDIEEELAVINSTISALQLKDEELDKKIADLRQYVDTELANNKDWANATFATLEQYSVVASDIEAIKASIIALNSSMEALDKRLEETVIAEVSKALEPIKDEMVASVILEVVDSYMEAINNAKNEITAAYTAAIASAISSLESSMKLWVSDQLKGYYTIAETEGKLAALLNTISENDKFLQAEIDELTEALATAKEETTAAYKEAIEDAINDNNGIVDGKIAIAIAEVNVRIENEIKAINAKIASIEGRLDKIEGDIATIGEQITNINNTIANLQDAKSELEGYIENLQNTSANLQKSINATNSKIDEVEAALKDEVSEAKVELLAQLTALKTDMEEELAVINSTISALQLKDEELDKKIADLRQYVDTELANNKDWASATFATLEQYASISSELAAIKAQMTAITQNISVLENRINNKIENDIAAAVSALNSSIQDKVNAITAAYSSAISDAKDEITTAYTAEIQNAFAALEHKMKNWVNEQLQEYYTIQEVNGLLAVLRNEVTTGDSALLAEIEALEEALAKSKEELINVYSEIVKKAINENNGVIDEKIAGAIAQATARIDSDIQAILVEIESIKNRLNKVEGDIANINGQIANINNTIQSLQNAQNELESYVGYLQSVASNLQESVNSINGKIDEVEATMQGELSTAKAEILAQLASLKADVEEELAQINEAIVILQVKDSELDNKITTLQSYVETELANNKDWANATFATLEQQGALAGEVATIKAQIATINQSISDLENRINAKVSKDIADAVAILNSTIQEKISEVTSAYMAAISKAKSDITAAYTADIQNAFSALESLLKRWVSEQLAGYYTIAEVDAMLAAMQNEFNGQLASQKAYLEGLISSLSNELTDQISTNSSLIASLRSSIDEIQNTTAAGNATKIAENAAAIAKNAQSIIDNAAAISANKTNTEANAALIASNKSAIEANSALIAQNKSAIEGLQATANAAIAKNATDIATNAENIAKNAALISQNATAINNNSQAIADNAADILQLQQDLAKAKEDITAAYKAAIKTAINTLDGELRGEIASQVSAINSRIDNEVATINAAIDALTARVTTLEGEVDAIQQQIADILQEIAGIKQDIADLMKRIQSVTYIPKYSDGKATMTKNVDIKNGTSDNGVAEFDFQISPKDAVKDIAANWQSILSMKAVYTQTRAVSFVELPILTFEADETTGVITITVSGENLSDDFFYQNIDAKSSLYITDGHNSISSEFIQLYSDVPAYRELRYTTSDNNPITLADTAITNVNVISNTCENGNGVIKFDGQIRSINDSAFSGQTTLCTILIPESVTNIGQRAFYECTSLKSTNLPTRITRIEGYTFYQCSSLLEAPLSNNLTYIGEDAFRSCSSLKTFIVPKSVKTLEFGVIRGCSSLEKTVLHSELDISFNVIGSSFDGCTGELEVYCNIPNKSYNSGSFIGSNFTKVTIGSQTIGDYAFYSCTTIKELIITDNVQVIGDQAFYHCSGLNTITIGKGIKSGGTQCYGAFSKCRGEVTMNSNVPSDLGSTLSGSGFFGGAYFSKITFGENVTSIGTNAFYDISCRSFYFKSQQPPKLSSSLWGYTNDYYITFYVPSNRVAEYKAAWSKYADNIVGYEFEDYVEETPETWKIRYTATAKVEPNKTDVFGAKIVSNEWDSTTGEGVITFDGEVTSIGSNAFDALEKTDIGSKLISISIPDTVTEIGYYSFCGCTSLESITIPDSVISIGQYAFCECSNLKDIVIPKSVKAIAAGAFIACNSLTSITIPDGISKIEVDTFTECAGLTEITIPDNITEIAQCAFSSCSSLQSVTIGSSVTKIEWHAFEQCTSLTNIYCKASTPPIMSEGYSPRDVFNGCSNIKKIYVPSTSVDAYKAAEYWKELVDYIIPYDFEKGEVVPENNQILAKIDIPDLALKNYLVDNYDGDGNHEISITEAGNVTMVDCSGKGVFDLTGLESCTNLVTLNCSNNNITKIELPNLAQLETVTCNDCPIELMNFNGCTSLQYLNLQDATTNAIIGNQLHINKYNQAKSLTIDVSNTTLEHIFVCRSEILAYLDVSKNTQLKHLEVYVNPNLKSIDVSTLVNLEILDLGDCDLTNLDVSKNLMLTELYVTNNKLSTIDVSKNKQLKVLKCKGNQISNMNVSNNDKLETLILEDNKLSAINVSNNTALAYLNINNNAEISIVDVRYNTSLKELYCNGLAIGELNIVNNTALTKLECNSNPNLTTLTCNNAFDFTTTHISINKGLKIISANASVLTPSEGDLITVNLGTGVVFSTSSNGSFTIVSASETSTMWYDAKTWCSNYGANWSFPSLNSLKSIYKNKSTINSTLSANGFTTFGTYYWSSTDNNGDEAVDSRYYAYRLNFSDGYSSSGSKNGSSKVRAVLSF